MNLIIDIGNTWVKLAITDQSGKQVDFQKHNVLTREIIQQLKEKYPESESCILSTVQESNPDLISFCKKLFPNFVVLDHTTPIPLKNNYDTPETLGKDRLAGAVGGYYIFPHTNLLIFDCGTAITIDYVSNTREFLGGNISPGITTRFKALNAFTRQLPLEEAHENIPEMGKNTRAAIEGGVLNGVIFELDGYINRFKIVHSNGKVLLTGGDAFYLASKIKSEIFVLPNLVTIGLNHILNYNIVNEFV